MTGTESDRVGHPDDTDDTERGEVTDLGAVAGDAEPHAVVHESAPQTVLLALDAGERVPFHEHPGTTVHFHVIEGAVTARVGDDRVEHELAAGELLRFDGGDG
ncbi:cupin domain-containing protein [Halobaculum sp. MBLA0147]|uniref:cupin domain-containing protein n=1 Tax=Halobaculum sp. MBLA0147 TaxID=3079934 RepID=UPI0035244032